MILNEIFFETNKKVVYFFLTIFSYFFRLSSKIRCEWHSCTHRQQHISYVCLLLHNKVISLTRTHHQYVTNRTSTGLFMYLKIDFDRNEINNYLVEIGS